MQYLRVCSFNFSGRQFEYDTVLQLIQNEDYLEDADIDELRRRDSVEKTGDFNADYDIPKHLDQNNWTPLQNQQNLLNKYNDNREMMYDLPYLDQNNHQIFQNYNYESENESVFEDPYQLIPQSRQKRALGKFLYQGISKICNKKIKKERNYLNAM